MQSYTAAATCDMQVCMLMYTTYSHVLAVHASQMHELFFSAQNCDKLWGVVGLTFKVELSMKW
jgi:hypothetical protein